MSAPEERSSLFPSRGQWVVVLRYISANDDELIGPYHSGEKAQAVADRLNRDISARWASHVMEAFVKFVRPGSIDLEEMRDEMLRDLEELGYGMRP